MESIKCLDGKEGREAGRKKKTKREIDKETQIFGMSCITV